MKVTNNTSFHIFTYIINHKYGPGHDMGIEPGQTAEVDGPYFQKPGDDELHSVDVKGSVICQEGPDDEQAYQVLQGQPLTLRREDSNLVMIRHYLDPRE